MKTFAKDATRSSGRQVFQHSSISQHIKSSDPDVLWELFYEETIIFPSSFVGCQKE
jgi:hypothetical protein